MGSAVGEGEEKTDGEGEAVGEAEGSAIGFLVLDPQAVSSTAAATAAAAAESACTPTDEVEERVLRCIYPPESSVWPKAARVPIAGPPRGCGKGLDTSARLRTFAVLTGWIGPASLMLPRQPEWTQA
ncbi:hypothetical protein GCM10010442_34620 [Kitasatospora kifunensis]